MERDLSLILVIVLLLAGCAGGGSLTSGDPPAPFAFGPIQTLEGDVVAFEPMIVSSGDLVVIAPGFPSQGGATSEPVIWISTDSGAHFRVIPIPSASPTGTFGEAGDIDVIIMNGTIYVATMWHTHIEMAKSRTAGEEWEVIGISQSLSYIDRPWLIAGPGDEEISLVYFQPSTGTWLATLDSAGGLARQRLIATTADILCVCAAGKPGRDPTTGALVVPLRGNSGTSGVAVIYAVRSTDLAWDDFSRSAISETRHLTTNSGIVSAVGTSQGLVIAFTARDGERLSAWVTMSQDGGSTWSPAEAVTPPERTGGFPLAFATADGWGIVEYSVPGSFKSLASAAGDWSISIFLASSTGKQYITAPGPVVHRGGLESQLRDFPSATAVGGRIFVAFTIAADGPAQIAVAPVVSRAGT